MKTSFSEGITETGEEGRLAGGWTIAGAMAAITESGGPSPLRSSYKIPPGLWSRFASFKFFAAAYLDDIEPARLAPTHSHGKINVLDPYSLCPCGSGKKFKWCCQPIHVEIEKAFQQDQDGQHEAALRLMEQVVAQHPDNPEAFGKQALLLWQNEKPDEADEALAKAFKIMPDYPFGHFLRGRFRQFEGEIAGALLLYRKAAEVYDPTAQAVLNEIFLSIFDCEMKLNRPVAARAAAMLAKGPRKCAEKLGEEAVEAVAAAAAGDRDGLVHEAADVLYHLQVTLKASGIDWGEVLAELQRREGRSGIAEKASRPR